MSRLSSHLGKCASFCMNNFVYIVFVSYVPVVNTVLRAYSVTNYVNK